MLKTIGNTEFVANSEKTEREDGGNSIVGNSMVGGGEATNQANSTKRKN